MRYAPYSAKGGALGRAGKTVARCPGPCTGSVYVLSPEMVRGSLEEGSRVLDLFVKKSARHRTASETAAATLKFATGIATGRSRKGRD